MMAKLIVTGATREQALARARRALAEFRIEGVASVLPFHKAVLNQADFVGTAGFNVHTRWIETEWDNTIEPFTGGGQVDGPGFFFPPAVIRVDDPKADILYKVFFGPVTPEVPGSILQFHSDVTLICDEAAAAKMPQEGQQCSI